MALEVLVVDDEADIRELVSGVLEDEGFTVRSAADSTAALEAIEERRPSLVLLDVWLQGSRLDGLQLLQEVKRRDPSLPVLMISGHGNLDTAVAAIREGAIDFIEKPFEAERLLHLVNRATETDRLRRENDEPRSGRGRAFRQRDRRRCTSGPPRAGTWRHALPGRDRGHAAHHAGENPACAYGPELPPDWGAAADQGRRSGAIRLVANGARTFPSSQTTS